MIAYYLKGAMDAMEVNHIARLSPLHFYQYSSNPLFHYSSNIGRLAALLTREKYYILKQ
jgi:hypothetical protein